MRLLATAVLIVATVELVQAEPRQRHSSHNHNYIIERQEGYQVQGVPTSRLIIGRREIDVYRNGLMFERDHLVGARSR